MAGTARAGPAARPGHPASGAPGRAVPASQAGPILVRQVGTGALARAAALVRPCHRRRMGGQPAGQARHGRPGLPLAQAGPASAAGVRVAGVRTAGVRAVPAGEDQVGEGQVGVDPAAAAQCGASPCGGRGCAVPAPPGGSTPACCVWVSRCH